MEQIDVNRAMRRSEAYWYEDGLGEIATGLFGLLLALAFLVDGLGRAPFENFVPISMMALALTGYWLGRTGVRAAKARWVFPRTGEVRYRSPGANGGAIAFAVAGAVSWGTLLVLRVLRQGPLRELPPSGGAGVLLGAALACLLLIVARDSGWQRRIVVVAGLAFLFGGLAFVSGSNENLQCSVLLGATSLALVTSGAVAFRSYLRHAPVAAPQADER